MKVCIPAATSDGLDGVPYGHFGSAPYYVIHDTANNTMEVLGNANQEHEHGACQPLQALDGHTVDAVIVGGIGAGAIMKLNASDIRVYKANPGTIAENVKALDEGALIELTPQSGCKQHSGCSH